MEDVFQVHCFGNSWYQLNWQLGELRKICVFSRFKVPICKLRKSSNVKSYIDYITNYWAREGSRCNYLFKWRHSARIGKVTKEVLTQHNRKFGFYLIPTITIYFSCEVLLDWRANNFIKTLQTPKCLSCIFFQTKMLIKCWIKKCV